MNQSLNTITMKMSPHRKQERKENIMKADTKAVATTEFVFLKAKKRSIGRGKHSKCEQSDRLSMQI